MALRDENLDGVEERHLDALVAAAVPEGRDVDYKRKLPVGSVADQGGLGVDDLPLQALRGAARVPPTPSERPDPEDLRGAFRWLGAQGNDEAVGRAAPSLGPEEARAEDVERMVPRRPIRVGAPETRDAVVASFVAPFIRMPRV